jgi:hypothetical protein
MFADFRFRQACQRIAAAIVVLIFGSAVAAASTVNVRIETLGINHWSNISGPISGKYILGENNARQYLYSDTFFHVYYLTVANKLGRFGPDKHEYNPIIDIYLSYTPSMMIG